MKVLYADEPPFTGHDTDEEESVFLVGPTPRSDDVPSWRPNALKILEDYGYNGLVLVPEREDWKTGFTYIDQVEWEYLGLTHATKIIAWVPRCMKTMLALTTNVEFGFWLARSPDRFFYGRPFDAPHTKYLDWMYEKHTGRKPIDNLNDLLLEAC